MKKLQPIPADAPAVLRRDVDDEENASVIFSVKEKKGIGEPRYNLKWFYDFHEVSRNELIALALKPLVIDGQGEWRTAKDKMDADVWQDRKWSVRAILDETPRKKSEAEKADAAIGKLTKVERDLLFAKYA